jgi:hypothetical protein
MSCAVGRLQRLLADCLAGWLLVRLKVVRTQTERSIHALNCSHAITAFIPYLACCSALL